MKFTPEEQAAQLRKPHGDGAIHIMDYMNRGNRVLYPAALEALELKPRMNILEVGQGNGALVHHIIAAAFGITYTGLDYSIDSVRIASEENKKYVENGSAKFMEGVISKMPFEDEIFDRVLGINTIYFWDAPMEELGEIHRVLKPGGIAVFGYRPKDKLSKLPFTNFGFMHYDPKEFESLLRQSGFVKTNSVRFPESEREIDGNTFPMECIVTIAQK